MSSIQETDQACFTAPEAHTGRLFSESVAI